MRVIYAQERVGISAQGTSICGDRFGRRLHDPLLPAGQVRLPTGPTAEGQSRENCESHLIFLEIYLNRRKVVVSFDRLNRLGHVRFFPGLIFIVFSCKTFP